jgi:hypothetical protein
MLRPRKKSDTPLAQRQRQLAEQERLLSEKMSRLHHQLNGGEPDGEAKSPELPIWRLEEDVPAPRRAPESLAQRRRALGRQRQQDMILFFVMMATLIVVVIMVMALARQHGNG